ncbi:MAG: translation initiation factor IF-2 [bacterium]|nr:translation initiation factor IF-2 [bacterium]MDZ4341858.1 translation initiation factor IF-2 [Candidatus Binatia bacterium]
MKARYKSRQVTKIIDLQQELRLSDAQLHNIMREVNVRLEEGQKNLDQNEVGQIRRYLNEQRRRAELRQQVIALPPIVRVQDFATALELSVGEILSVLLKNGVMATLNDDIDYETAAIIAEDLGYKTQESVEKLEEDVLTPEKLDEILKKEDPKEQQDRPPVVTIMGHVDHGKTTLLDSIRQSNVAAKEAGGITQAISSYQVEYKGREITFIDTPGHETFEFMRQRGASLADVAILVVAADDGVKPQTKEAVNHARAAGVPIVVAINKIDKPGVNLEKVKKELSDLDLMPEEWGGKTVTVPVSALKKEGIDELLEMILLTADISKPKANPNRPALGSVIESRLDKNLGPLATILVHTGTLSTGDDIVVGRAFGHVRRLLDFRGKTISKATPSTPTTIVGLDDVPDAGEVLQAVEARGEARAKASQRRAPVKSMAKTDENDKRQILALVIKADSRGSLEALKETIKAMVPEEVRLSIIRAEAGAVSDSDVLTARAGDAIIYAFNTNVGGMARKLAEKEDVKIKTYKIIYELTDDVRKEIEERLPVDVVRTDLGTLKVLKVFFSIQKRKIVGGEVADGTIEPQAHVIVWRKENKDKVEIGQGIITALQKERQEITHAQQGDQVGLTYEGKGKIKEGDVLEIYKEEKVKRQV